MSFLATRKPDAGAEKLDDAVDAECFDQQTFRSVSTIT